MKQACFSWSAYASKRNLSRNRLLSGQHIEVVDEFILFFGQISNQKKILDVGPANGFFMTLLRELGFLNVQGLELSPVFLDILRAKNLEAYAGNAMTGEGMEQLSPPYDVIIMMEILEHLEEPEPALENIKKLMAKDGMLYFTVPICNCIISRLQRLVRRISRAEQIRNIDETHIQTFSKKSIIEMLSKAGFEVKEARNLSFKWPFSYTNKFSRKVFLLFRFLLPNCSRGLFLSVIAKKIDNGG